ncbi:MAG: hypothetical protein B7Z54_04225 [Sphingobacteriales bacterium 12-47-4]|nr:MAG: hypothetical protein B7Z54_04225 [Sphingobacteriales bacterium 12-47-4]
MYGSWVRIPAVAFVAIGSWKGRANAGPSLRWPPFAAVDEGQLLLPSISGGCSLSHSTAGGEEQAVSFPVGDFINPQNPQLIEKA